MSRLIHTNFQPYWTISLYQLIVLLKLLRFDQSCHMFQGRFADVSAESDGTFVTVYEIWIHFYTSESTPKKEDSSFCRKRNVEYLEKVMKEYRCKLCTSSFLCNRRREVDEVRFPILRFLLHFRFASFGNIIIQEPHFDSYSTRFELANPIINREQQKNRLLHTISF